MDKEWIRRKQRMQNGRMVYACPAEGERYYLCVLLNHVRGATSFDDLKTTGTALNFVHDRKTVYILTGISPNTWWARSENHCGSAI
jgi:hypothetical protein